MEDAPSTADVEKYVKRAMYAFVILMAILVAFAGYGVFSFVEWLHSR